MQLPKEIFVFQEVFQEDDDEPDEIELHAAEKFADLLDMAQVGEHLVVGTYKLVSEDTIINGRSR
jgi:hypothetical protein